MPVPHLAQSRSSSSVVPSAAQPSGVPSAVTPLSETVQGPPVSDGFVASPSRWYKTQPRRKFGVSGSAASAPPAGGPGCTTSAAHPDSGTSYAHAAAPAPRLPTAASRPPMPGQRDLSPTRRRQGPATALTVTGLMGRDAHLNGDYTLEEMGRFVQSHGPGVLAHREGRWKLSPAAGAAHACSSPSLLGQWQPDRTGADHPPAEAYPFVVATRTRDSGAPPPATPAPAPSSMHERSRPPPAPAPSAEAAGGHPDDERRHSVQYAEDVKRTLERQLDETRRELGAVRDAMQEERNVYGHKARRTNERLQEVESSLARLERELLFAQQNEARVGILFEEAEELAAALFWLSVPLQRFQEASAEAARSERAAHEATAAELAQQMQANQVLIAEREDWMKQLAAERDAQHKTAMGAEHLAKELETWRNDVKETLQQEELQAQMKLQSAAEERDEAQKRIEVLDAEVLHLATQLQAVQLRADHLEGEKQNVIAELREQLADMKRVAATESRVREELLYELQESRRDAQNNSALLRENLASRLDLLAVTAKEPAMLAVRIDTITSHLAARFSETEADLANSAACVQQLSDRLQQQEEHIHGCEKRIEDYERDLEEARENADYLRQQANDAAEQRDTALERADALAQQLDSLAAERDDYAAQLQGKDTQQHSLLVAAEATAERQAEESAQLQQEAAQLQQEVDRLTQEVARLLQEVARLEEALKVARVEEGMVQRLADKVRHIESELSAQADDDIKHLKEQHALEKARLTTRMRELEEEVAALQARSLHNEVTQVLFPAAAPSALAEQLPQGGQQQQQQAQPQPQPLHRHQQQQPAPSRHYPQQGGAPSRRLSPVREPQRGLLGAGGGAGGGGGGGGGGSGGGGSDGAAPASAGIWATSPAAASQQAHSMKEWLTGFRP